MELGCDEISLGDTIGAATPGDVHRLTLRSVGRARVGLHAHDTAAGAGERVRGARAGASRR
jgi:hydroxymethylglutaryl-CoA lyase